MVHVIIVYATAAFVILELINNVTEPLKLPEWTTTLVILILLVGFPLAIIFSWIFDVTPEGIEKTKPSKESKKGEKAFVPNSWRIASYISFVVIVVLVLYHVLSSNKSRRISKIEKSIAVLPFNNWSAGEEYAHMGSAIANEIITELSKVKDFHVVSYTSSSRYTDSNKLSIPQIGQELGANFIIEGSVERQNDSVNIHVQVILAENDEHLWANEFLGDWNDIFKIQDDIALKVAEKLMAVLTPEERVSIDQEPTRNPEAYDYYLRGKNYYEENRLSLNEEAIYWFKESIRLDSTFALPWTHLAMIYWRKSSTTDSPEFQNARLAAEKAYELAPTSGITIVNMAEILENEYNFKEAEEKIIQALKIEPDNPYVLRNAGRFYTLLGRQNLSISYCKRALQDDPTNPTALVYLTRAYFYAGDYSDAWTSLEAMQKLGRSGNSMLYYQLLLEEDNLEKIVNEPSYNDNIVAHSFGLAAAHIISGNKNIADSLINSMKENNIPGYNYLVALAHAYGDDAGQVCIWLERSFDAKERYLTYLRVDPGFRKYRHEPQVKNILKKMKFTI